MTRNDKGYEELRETFSASVEVAGDGSSCPPWEELWESARGELGRQDEDRILMHVGECPACAAAWRVAYDMAEDSTGGEASTRERGGRPSWWIPLAAAAVFVLAMVGLNVFDRAPLDDAGPVYRTQEREWLKSLVPEDEPLPREDCLLRWTPAPEGTTYQVRVTTESLDLIDVGRALKEPEFRVPASALERLPSGSEIFWQVSARLPDGRQAESEAFVSRIE
jgi:hypothetical protein